MESHFSTHLKSNYFKIFYLAFGFKFNKQIAQSQTCVLNMKTTWNIELQISYPTLVATHWVWNITRNCAVCHATLEICKYHSEQFGALTRHWNSITQYYVCNKMLITFEVQINKNIKFSAQLFGQESKKSIKLTRY